MSVAGWPAIKVTTAVYVAASTWMKVVGSGGVPAPVPAKGSHEDKTSRTAAASRASACHPAPRFALLITQRATALAKCLELRVGELDRQRRQVLLQVIERQRARNRQHRRRALKEPGKRDLLRCHAMPPGDFGKRSASIAAQGEEGHEHNALGSAVVDDCVVLALR